MTRRKQPVSQKPKVQKPAPVTKQTPAEFYQARRDKAVADGKK